MFKKTLIVTTAICGFAYANITGTVFEDLPLRDENGVLKLNSYAVKDANEKGVAGVSVTGIDENGNSVSAVTQADGSFNLNGLSGKVRVEFSNIPNYLKESPSSDKKNSTVRFVQDQDSVNLALYNPSEYVNETNPIVTTSVFSVGKNTGEPTLLYWHYDDNNTYNDTKDQYYGDSNQTGSVWGIAYDKDTDTIYYSAAVRRHMGLGPLGIGGIYTVKGARKGTPKVASWLDVVNDLGIDLGSVDRSSDTCHQLPNTPNKKTHDPDGYLKTGIAGLGDIDLTQDNKTLYVMDIKNKQIIAIDTKTKEKKNTFPISDPGCEGGTYRPWAISTHNNSLYVGVVCDASYSQNADDLHAYVLKFNGAGYDNVLDFDLNYTRTTTCCNSSAKWQPWTTDLTWHGSSHPEPILSDIEFDETGAMILAFTDRYGMVSGNNDYSPACDSTDTAEGHSGGEILRACKTDTGWNLENNGTCADTTTAGAGNGQGIGGGEFYAGDAAGRNDNGLSWSHDEAATGALAILQGSKQVATTVFDPINADSGGVKVLSNITGHSITQKELYPSEGGPGPHMGKAGGLGDLEIISAPAPVEIGNRVWFDENGNGIQDANETGIDNVKVQLLCDGFSSVEAITKNGGYYIFSNDSNKTDTDNRKYNLTQLQPGNPNNCKIAILDISSQAALNNKKATIAKQGLDKAIDSNGAENGDSAEADIAAKDIPFGGANNHSFDFGFKKADICLGDYVWEDKNINGLQDDGNTGIDNIKIYLLDSSGNELNSTVSSNGGKYKFCGLKPGNYKIKFDLSTLPPHYAATAANAGNDENDSDANPNTGETATIVIKEGSNDNFTIDMGIYKKPCLGDYVWLDKNANGIQDSSERGIDGVSVKLYDASGANELGSTATADGGRYKFCDLEPNTEYKVKFELHSKQYKISPKDQGSDDSKDSDANKADKTAIASVGTDDNMTIDAGVYQTACVGNRIWLDSNANGIQDDGEVNVTDTVTVELLDSNGNLAKDADGKSVAAINTSNGEYKFCNLAPGDYKVKITPPPGYGISPKNAGDTAKDSDIGLNKETDIIHLNNNEKDMSQDAGLYKLACIGDYIWDDLNANGIQDDGEEGMKDIKVNLLDENGNIIASQNTNSEGKYNFCKLKPGKYKVQVKVPKEWYVTRKDKGGNDAKDSDMGAFLDTDKIVEMPQETIIGNENNMTLDGGIFKPSCLGSTVWEDKNANGIKDDGEPGIKDVNVTLLPVKDYGYEGNRTLIGQSFKTVTDKNGNYKFCGLIPGKYRVMFEAPLAKDGSPRFTTSKNSGSDNKDSDTEAYKSGAVVSDPVDVNSKTDNLSVFAGYIEDICIGDYMWYDKNLNGIQDSNEAGIIGVKVHLTYADGTTVKDVYGHNVTVTETDSNGKYKFCHLIPNKDYKIKFDIPDTYMPTLQNKGADIKDSDADKNGVITVKAPTKNDWTNDIGIYCECDDYKANPQNHKKLKASALNIYGTLLSIIAMLIFSIIKKEQ